MMIVLHLLVHFLLAVPGRGGYLVAPPPDILARDLQKR